MALCIYGLVIKTIYETQEKNIKNIYLLVAKIKNIESAIKKGLYLKASISIKNVFASIFCILPDAKLAVLVREKKLLKLKIQ